MNEKRLALAALLATFLLILVGGLVHSTGSGLACPDWPLCKGQFFPQMVAGVEYEHSHRLAALLVVVTTVWLNVLLWRKKSARGLAKVALFAFCLVLFQAFLGALTVIYKLPMFVKAAHLSTAMFFFSVLIFIAYRLHAAPVEAPADFQKQQHFLKPLAFAAVLAIYAQIVLGAFVRHSGAGGVCPSIPFCEGVLWPSDAHPAIRLHMAHRLWGVVSGFLMMLVAGFSFRAARFLPAGSQRATLLRLLAGATPFLIAFQIVLGFVSVKMDLATAPITAHLGGGALLLAVALLFALALEGEKAASTSPSLLADLISLAKVRLASLVMLTMAIPYALGSHHFFSLRTIAALGGVFFLSAGASFLNCYFERDIDAHMERTKMRPLPSGRRRADFVLYAGVGLAILTIPLLTLAVNPVTGFLGAIAFISYAWIYTPLKAKTPLAALIGGIPGALPPLMGWTAARGEIDFIGATLFFILFFWQMPHFFAIALYRRDEYQNAGIHVMPLDGGEGFTKKLMLRYTLMLIPVSLFLVPLGVAGRAYFVIAILLGAGFLGLIIQGISHVADRLWARRVFYYSLIYLPVLFISLLLDAKI